VLKEASMPNKHSICEVHGLWPTIGPLHEGQALSAHLYSEKMKLK
jgi:hypothetical protein